MKTLLQSRRRLLLRVMLSMPLGLGVVFHARAVEARRRDIELLAKSHLDDLHNICSAILPSSLTHEELGAFVKRFIKWLRNQQVGAEKDHSVSRISLPRHPGWLVASRPFKLHKLIDASNYLRDIEELKKKLGVASLAGVPVKQARQTIAALIESKIHALRVPLGEELFLQEFPSGNNLYADLLSVFYHGPLALDIMYQRRLHSRACAGFANLAKKPPKRSAT